MKTAVKPEWRDLVRKHGHRIEKFIEAGETNWAGWWKTPYHSGLGSYSYSLTHSEEQALESIKKTFGIDQIRRPASGVDFIYGNIGFEVKSIDWWKLSDNQKKAMDLLEATFMIVSNRDGVKVEKVIR